VQKKEEEKRITENIIAVHTENIISVHRKMFGFVVNSTE
jgi:hypothetical protein